MSQSTSRRDFLKLGGTGLAATALPFLKVLPADAATRDTLVVVSGETINSLDLHRTGTNRPSYQVAIEYRKDKGRSVPASRRRRGAVVRR